MVGELPQVQREEARLGEELLEGPEALAVIVFI